MAVRYNKKHADRVREQIGQSQILTRLKKHALGDEEMSSTQVRAAEILLKKCLPDLQSTELSAEVSSKTVDELTETELVAIAGGKVA